MILRRMLTFARPIVIALGGLIAIALINDRGLLSVNNLLDIGREYLPLRSVARASQNTCIMPTTGTVSGLQLVTDINACNDSILTLYSGATAPAGPSTGMLWRDTSVSPSIIKQYDSASWNILWYLDASNHLAMLQIGGGTTTRRWRKTPTIRARCSISACTRRRAVTARRR
jgi:hypothetical protein